MLSSTSTIARQLPTPSALPALHEAIMLSITEEDSQADVNKILDAAFECDPRIGADAVYHGMTPLDLACEQALPTAVDWLIRKAREEKQDIAIHGIDNDLGPLLLACRNKGDTLELGRREEIVDLITSNLYLDFNRISRFLKKVSSSVDLTVLNADFISVFSRIVQSQTAESVAALLTALAADHQRADTLSAFTWALQHLNIPESTKYLFAAQQVVCKSRTEPGAYTGGRPLKFEGGGFINPVAVGLLFKHLNPDFDLEKVAMFKVDQFISVPHQDLGSLLQSLSAIAVSIEQPLQHPQQRIQQYQTIYRDGDHALFAFFASQTILTDYATAFLTAGGIDRSALNLKWLGRISPTGTNNLEKVLQARLSKACQTVVSKEALSAETLYDLRSDAPELMKDVSLNLAKCRNFRACLFDSSVSTVTTESKLEQPSGLAVQRKLA